MINKNQTDGKTSTESIGAQEQDRTESKPLIIDSTDLVAPNNKTLVCKRCLSFNNKLYFGICSKCTKELDFCNRCMEYIDQVEIQEGVFGCPLCKTNDNIKTFYQGEE